MSAKRASYLLLVALSLLCLGFGPPRLTNGDLASRTLTPDLVWISRGTEPPEITAAAAILVDSASGEVLLAKNEHERRAPASLTKIVTAMVALERAGLTQEFPVWPADLMATSVAGLRNGEQVSVRQLLFMMLVPSDNAAASALARNIGGDVDTFVQWMNEWVGAWGLTNTHFVNPHGLDEEGHYSSAWDMAILARSAMQNATFAEIVAYEEAVVARHWIVTTNELLNAYPGMIGVKTGTTDNAGQCFIGMVRRPQGTVICVVMGSEDRFMDARLLLDYYYANFAEVQVALPESPLNRYQDETGAWHELYLKESRVLLVAPWEAPSVTYYRRIDELAVHPDVDQPVGALIVSCSDRLIAEVPLYAR